MFDKIKVWYRSLPDKKRHIEFFTALLSVPVLLTVILINLSNLEEKKTKITPTPQPTEKIIVITSPVSPVASASPTLTPTVAQCKKEVGPARISSPSEDELINSSPVCIKISYQTGEFCGVVWSYRLDKGAWSDFTDKELCLYDLPAGPKELQLRVKSNQSDDEITLIRNFYFKTKELPTPTQTQPPLSQ